MAQQLIGLGAAADDHTGDTLRAGGGKINANFTELYGALFRPVQASQAIAANDFVNIYDSAGDLRVRKADASDPTKLASGAADKPLVIESGKIKQLPASTTLQINASGTGAASINIPHGAAPTSPNNGDCWTTTGGLFCRVNGATVGPYSTGSGGAIASK